MYFIGFLVLIAAIAMGMNMIGIGAQWIFVVCLALFGIAVMSAVKHTRSGSEGDGT
jgi:hypothetical protein